MTTQIQISEIRKRDGRIVKFEQEKITNAIHKAILAVKSEDGILAKQLSDQVVSTIEEKFKGKIPGVEDVQDIVEEVLIRNGLANVAKAYILYRQKRTELREAKKFIGVYDELKLSLNAISVLERRYLLKDEKGNLIETPAQMFRRVAKAIAAPDLIYDKNADVKKTEEEFYQMMANLEFLPNSPTLFNAGTALGQLAACFVLDVSDSLSSIFEAVKNAALIFQSGGGVGYSFSKLRPKGDMVKSTKSVASGPCSFMRVFDVATDVIKSGGKRRGANMGILRVDHPDIIEFITAKEKEGQLANFNISVAVTDKFMEAVEKDEQYDLINPRTGKPVKKLRARDVFDLIVTMAWRTGDPGIIFIDEINRHNPTPTLGAIESTNPCGEIPLLPYESCNLGSINLSKMVNKEKKEIDWEKLRRAVHTAVHFLDNVIDANKYPLPEIEKMTKANRKIGLGIMGFADALLKLGIRYDSEEALAIAEKLMKFISDEARKKSVELSLGRGSFPNFEVSIWKEKGYKAMRNATLTTIAPTGTISIIAGCSSGIEPNFAVSFIRNVMGTQLLEVNQHFEKIARERGLYSTELMMKIARKGSIQNMKEIPEDIQRVFVTSLDISPEWHVRMQAAFQRYVDNAVAKCITGDSLVFTEHGILPIKEIGKAEEDNFTNIKIMVMDNPTKVLATSFYYGGIKDIIKIKTSKGFEIAGTPNHRIKTLDGDGKIKWKFLSEISKSDFALITYGMRYFGNKYLLKDIYGHYFKPEYKTNAKKIKFPIKITKIFGRFLGYFISEGSCTKNTVKFSQNKNNALCDYTELVNKIFSIKPKLEKDKRRRHLYSCNVNSRILVKFLRDYIGISDRANRKSVPKCILMAGKEVIEEFIKGLTLDGHVDESQKRICILSTTSRELAKQVHLIILNLGIISSLVRKKSENGFEYRIFVSGRYIKEFLRRIGYAEEEKMWKALKIKKRFEYDTSDLIPNVKDLIKRLIDRKKIECKSEKLKIQLRGLLYGKQITRENLHWLLDISREFANKKEYRTLQTLLNKNLFFDVIKDINIDKDEVYDLYIPESNSFVANGFINHNTVNLPHEATLEDVRKIFWLAYKLKCKGVTIYRYGSKKEQVLYIGPAVSKTEGGREQVTAESEYAGECPTGVCPF